MSRILRKKVIKNTMDKKKEEAQIPKLKEKRSSKLKESRTYSLLKSTFSIWTCLAVDVTLSGFISLVLVVACFVKTLLRWGNTRILAYPKQKNKQTKIIMYMKFSTHILTSYLSMSS